ncbi:MAG: hypothetical protein ACK52I_30220 [Pseudomonadota bacterium]
MNHQAAHNQSANITALRRGVQRYGFQGQEEDQEMWEGAVSYKYRVEDARLGRFFSVDPIFRQYSWNSNYAFSENRVVDGIELEGLEYADAKTGKSLGPLNTNAAKDRGAVLESQLKSSGNSSSSTQISDINPANSLTNSKTKTTEKPENKDVEEKGFRVYPPEITANLSTYAGVTLERSGMGGEFNAGGTVVFGIKENTLHVAGYNTETGNREVTESYGLGCPYAGFTYEKVLLGNRNGPTICTIASVNFFGFFYVEKREFPDGTKINDIGIQAGGKTGAGLVFDAGIKIPLYRE